MNFHKIHESIIDDPQPSENPYVWRDGKINPLIRIRVVDLLTEKKIPFREIMIIGSITGKFWSVDSDIDVTVFCDVNDETLLEYRKLARIMNERNFFGTFPMSFYFRTDNPKELETLADGIYDLLQDHWVKEPLEIDEVEEALKNPKKLAEAIARRLDTELDKISADVQELTTNYGKSDLNFDEKLNFLQLELDDYVIELDAIHKKRLNEFTKALEGSELKTYQHYKTKNILPWNIIYKLLTKWLYFKWQGIFRDELKTGEVKMQEAKDIFRRFVRYWI